MLNNIKVVLIGTSHPGNIGSAARAMKVMGLTNMVLVAPQCNVDEQTISLASGASDVAVNAPIVDTLEQAIEDCTLVVGSSARSRTLDWPMLEPRECGTLSIQTVIENQLQLDQRKDEDGANEGVGKVALVFGRERTGLTNEELQTCHYHVAIPANPEYSSLNLAMAVQTISYEVRMAWLEAKNKQYPETQEADYPRNKELELFYGHLEKVLYETQFISEDKPNLVMNKLRRLFTRARPERQELNMLRGILTAVQKIAVEKKSR